MSPGGKKGGFPGDIAAMLQPIGEVFPKCHARNPLLSMRSSMAQVFRHFAGGFWEIRGFHGELTRTFPPIKAPLAQAVVPPA
jgi:hypothetical protein